MDGGSFIVRPEWQFILPARRTEGTSPSDINDTASREDLLRNSTGRDRKGKRREGGRQICHLHVNDVAFVEYIFSSIKGELFLAYDV